MDEKTLEEQLEELQQQLDEKNEALEAKGKEIAEKEEALKKFEDKDYNFKKVREGKHKIEEEKTTLEEQLANMQKRLDARDAATLGATKEAVLSQLSGDDDGLRAKIEAEYKSYGDEPVSEVEIQHRLEKASRNVQWEQEQGAKVNPMNKYVPPSMGPVAPKRNRQNFADTEEGKGLAKQMGLQQAKVEKK